MWLTRMLYNIEIQDGILFDRFTMVRVRKTLERNSKVYEPLIDMHTGNDFVGGGMRTDAVQ